MKFFNNPEVFFKDRKSQEENKEVDDKVTSILKKLAKGRDMHLNKIVELDIESKNLN